MRPFQYLHNLAIHLAVALRPYDRHIHLIAIQRAMQVFGANKHILIKIFANDEGIAILRHVNRAFVNSLFLSLAFWLKGHPVLRYQDFVFCCQLIDSVIDRFLGEFPDKFFEKRLASKTLTGRISEITEQFFLRRSPFTLAFLLFLTSTQLLRFQHRFSLFHAPFDIFKPPLGNSINKLLGVGSLRIVVDLICRPHLLDLTLVHYHHTV